MMSKEEGPGDRSSGPSVVPGGLHEVVVARYDLKGVGGRAPTRPNNPDEGLLRRLCGIATK